MYVRFVILALAVGVLMGGASPTRALQVPADRGTHKLTSVQQLPSVVDLSPSMPPVGSQQSQFSCTAWAVAYVKSFQEQKARAWGYSSDHIFSPNYVFNQRATANNKGIYIHDAFDVLRKQGVAPVSESPISTTDWQTQPTQQARAAAAQYKADGRRIFNGTLDDGLTGLRLVKEHLANNRDLVIVSIPIYLNSIEFGLFPVEWRDGLWNSVPPYIDIKSSSFTQPPTRLEFTHSVAVVGYNDDTGTLRFINSWGTNWGTNGYGFMTYNFFIEEKQDIEAWVMTPIAASSTSDLNFDGVVNSFDWSIMARDWRPDSDVCKKLADCKISMFIYGILQYFSFKTLQNILNFD